MSATWFAGTSSCFPYFEPAETIHQKRMRLLNRVINAVHYERMHILDELLATRG